MLEFFKRLFGSNLGFTTLNDANFQQAIKIPKSVIIDVRTKSEFDQSKLPNAMNFDVFSPNFAKRISGMDKDKSYFVYCQSGNR